MESVCRMRRGEKRGQKRRREDRKQDRTLSVRKVRWPHPASYVVGSFDNQHSDVLENCIFPHCVQPWCVEIDCCALL